jgi:hypothetical protein
MTNKNEPWNKGKKGLEAGWTKARRKRASEMQKAWLKANPDNLLNIKGPRPQIWATGPDPLVREVRYRYSRSKAQAKFWGQKWTLKWEDYLDFYKTAPGKWSRDMEDLNLARIDTDHGWHIWNVKLMPRKEAMTRPTKGKKRIKPKGLGTRPRSKK